MNYIIKKDRDIEYLQFNKLLEFQDDMFHGFTLKTQNVGLNKDETNIQEQFNKIEAITKSNEILKPYQKHTDNIIEIKNGKEKLIETDGLITNLCKKVLVISIADCICLMMYDPKEKVIANIHSGWKGTIKKIAEKAVIKMVKDYNCKANNIICAIGPCIRKDHFLVNDDVKNIFENEFYEYCEKNQIIEETNEFNEKGKQYRIDTVLINELILKNLGILDKNIIDSNICTICNKYKFHSYRDEGKNFQKNMGIMMIK